MFFDDDRQYPADWSENPAYWPPIDLDRILGRPSCVRVLRVLSAQIRPRWTAEIVHEAGLSRAGTWRAVDRLVAEGIVVRVGVEFGGRSFPIALNHRHPLYHQLKDLFSRETMMKHRAAVQRHFG